MSNQQEELAGTDPNDPDSLLIITSFTTAAGGAPATVEWQSVLTRFYYLWGNTDLGPGGTWVDSGLGLIAPDGATTTRVTIDPSVPMRFYRVEAVKPLAP
jgi:hypothetical protein